MMKKIQIMPILIDLEILTENNQEPLNTHTYVYSLMCVKIYLFISKKYGFDIISDEGRL